MVKNVDRKSINDDFVLVNTQDVSLLSEEINESYEILNSRIVGACLFVLGN